MFLNDILPYPKGQGILTARANRKVYKGIIPYYSMDRLTIYPDKELQEKLNKEAEKQKRSLNNLILFILASYFEKKHGKE